MLITKKTAFKEYFHQELDLASSSLSFHVKNYLVEMLFFYLPSDRFFERKKGQTKFYERALVDMYKKSQLSRPYERISLLKKIGDFCLCFSGFFRSALKRKSASPSYYEQMGQGAYHFVSLTYGPKSNTFKELSLEFKALAQILFSIQKRSEKQNLKNILDFSRPNSF